MLVGTSYHWEFKLRKLITILVRIIARFSS